MKLKKLLNTKGEHYTGLYYIDLKDGKNIYARFNLATGQKRINLTKAYNIKNKTDAVNKRVELLLEFSGADYLFNKKN